MVFYVFEVNMLDVLSEYFSMIFIFLYVVCFDIMDCLNFGCCRDYDCYYYCLDSECMCLKDEDILY